MSRQTEGQGTDENCAQSKPVRVDCALGAWQPIETVPKRNKAVLLWHTVWKCPVAAKYKKGNWLEITLTTLWPANAFSHWMPLPPAPVESP